MSPDKRLAKLEQVPGMRLARARAGSLPLEQLTDTELHTLANEVVPPELKDACAVLFAQLSDEELDSLFKIPLSTMSPRVRAVADQLMEVDKKYADTALFPNE